MRTYWTMPSALHLYYHSELAFHKSELKRGNRENAWVHLERAHILGQKWFLQHSYIHWKMLVFGIQSRNIKEVAGQFPRLLIGGLKSFVGKIPVGNTGRANMPPMQPMAIPDDLAQILMLG